MPATSASRLAVLVGLLLLALQASAPPVLAQENVGRIVGVVHDPSQAAVPNARVTAQQLATGAKWEASTNSAGAYSFPALTIGEYTITASVQGFRSVERPNIRVVAGRTLSVDFELQLGEVTQTVKVEAEPAKVDTVTNTVGVTMESEQLSQLPLAMSGTIRSAYQYLSTQSTVIGDSVIAGAPSGQAEGTIDGVHSSQAPNGPTFDFFAPTPETIAEVRLVTDQTSAEHGANYGTMLGLITKSGTNELHGTLFHFLRNDKLDARSWFASKRSPQRQNEWGVTVGGPVTIPKIYNGKDKTFFYAYYGGFRYSAAAGGITASVPTTKMRAGDFSEVLGAQLANPDALGRPVFAGQIYDPLTSRSDGKGGFIRDPFLNNVIPQNRHSRLSRTFQDLYPLPTLPGTALNWVGSRSADGFPWDKWSLKIDHRFNERHSLTGSWERSDHTIITGSIFDPKLAVGPAPNGTWNVRVPKRFRLNYYWVTSPSLLFNFRTGVNLGSGAGGAGAVPESRTFGAEAGWKGVFSQDTPVVSVQGFQGFGQPFHGKGLNIPQMTIPANVDLTWTKGRHNIKIGASDLLAHTGQDWNVNTAGSVNFSQRTTGLPGVAQTGSGWASYLLGDADSAGLSSPKPGRFTTHNLGFYVQDSWRATSKLTFNFGTRYELFLPMKETHDRFGGFDPSIPNSGANGLLGALTFWGHGEGRNGREGLWDTYWKAISPNFGFVYALRPSTVVRASYAFTSTGFFGVMTGGLRAPLFGWSAGLSVLSQDNGITPGLKWDNGFPLERFPTLPNLNPAHANGGSPFWVDPTNTRPGRVQSLNFGIEQEMKGLVFRANYIGRLAHGLPVESLVQLNQFDPSLLSLGNLLLANIDSQQARNAGIAKPYPTFTGSVAQALRPYPHYQTIVEYIAPVGFNIYHGAEFSVQKRFGHGLSLFATYSISKLLTNIDSFGGQGSTSSPAPIQHTYHRNIVKSLYSGGDTPQNFVINYVYDLPFGPGKRFANTTNGVLKQLVGGWKIAGIHQYRSGTPIRIGTAGSLPIGYGPQWANRVEGVPMTTNNSCGSYDPNDPSKNRYLNIAAFATPAPFTFGNTLTLPDVRTCGYKNENISLLKMFPVRESVQFELGADFFNIFNRHYWTGLATNIGTPASFGRYGGTTGPRNVQLHLKLHF